MGTQFLTGVAGPLFLHKGGDHGCENQDQNQVSSKWAQYNPKPRGLSRRFERLWPVLFDAVLSICF